MAERIRRHTCEQLGVCQSRPGCHGCTAVISINDTTRRFPRTLAEAFPAERQAPFTGPYGSSPSATLARAAHVFARWLRASTHTRRNHIMTPNPAHSMRPQAEQLVRLVHVLGDASVAELLTQYREQPLSAAQARYTLGDLVARGWLLRSGRGRYSLTEAAVPHVLSDERLPLTPTPVDPLPKETRSSLRIPGIVAPGRDPTLYRQPWVGLPAAPMRDGAMDASRISSRGLRC